MAKYVKNPGGAIHSVPDDFQAPAEWGDKWSELTEAQAKADAPQLFGAADPAVAAAELHDRASQPVPVNAEPAVSPALEAEVEKAVETAFAQAEPQTPAAVAPTPAAPATETGAQA